MARAARLRKRLDPRAVARYLAGALHPRESLYAGVFRVPPGHAIDVDAAEVRPFRVWTAPAATPTPGDVPRPEDLKDALGKAVVRQATEPSAACALSGGLDSSAIVALASRSGRHVRAYTMEVSYGDDEERRAAERVARAFQAEQRCIAIRDDELPDQLPSTVRACEEPLWNGAAAARHLFFQRVRARGEEALLSGVGADEMLCGQPQALASFVARHRAEATLGAEVLSASAHAEVAAGSWRGPDTAQAGLEAARRAFIDTRLPESTLPPECRPSASEGLDVRLPFLEAEFAGAALRIPADGLVRDGLGKWALREAMRDLLPDDVRLARKTPRLLAPRAAAERKRWLELHDAWLAPSRLAALECVDAARARDLIAEASREATPAERLSLLDAVLTRLTSLSILAADSGAD